MLYEVITNAIDDTSQVGLVDVVLVGVKTWQVPEVAGAIQPLLVDRIHKPKCY